MSEPTPVTEAARSVSAGTAVSDHPHALLAIALDLAASSVEDAQGREHDNPLPHAVAAELTDNDMGAEPDPADYDADVFAQVLDNWHAERESLFEEHLRYVESVARALVVVARVEVRAAERSADVTPVNPAA